MRYLATLLKYAGFKFFFILFWFIFIVSFYLIGTMLWFKIRLNEMVYRNGQNFALRKVEVVI